MLKVGDPVPDFSFSSEAFGSVSSASLRGKRYVMYFYPKDDTPGCTREACAFRDNLPRFGTLSVKVFGISADDEKSHLRFARKHSLNFKLIPDPDHVICDAFGTWIEKSMYGRSYMGVARSTFVVGPDARIEKIWEKVSPDGHAEEVFAWLNGDPIPVPVKPAAIAKAVIARPAPAAPPVSEPPGRALSTEKPVVASKPAPPARSVETSKPASKPAAKKAAVVAKVAKAKPSGAKARKAGGAKASPAKSAARKPTAKPVSASKTASRKAALKKPVGRKAAAKPLTVKKVPAKKVATKKVAAKKAAAKKPASSKPASRAGTKRSSATRNSAARTPVSRSARARPAAAQGASRRPSGSSKVMGGKSRR